MTTLEFVYLVSIAHVWSRGSIFKRIRTSGPKLWQDLADCPLCSGFWIGAIGHIAYVTFPNIVMILGIGSCVGTLSLAVYGTIRRI